MQTAGMLKQWRSAEPAAMVEDDAPQDAHLRGLPPLIAQLLSQRGLADPEDAERFLNPKLLHLHDPAELPGCETAAQLITQALRDNRPVVVYGDYDVDGVTASAILWHTLTTLGGTVHTYIPHRLDEGYGLNSEALQQLADDPGLDNPLIVTVDCGITATEQATLAKALGLQLIITDHHAFDPAGLPDAAALVHPELILDFKCEISDVENATPSLASAHQKSEIKNLKSPLCGAGVAYKLAWQTAKTFYNSDRLPDQVRKLLLDLLAFAALGTVADVVPLVGENRVITVYGLSRIKATDFNGLNALIDTANLRDDKIDAYHVGFVLGPRLNACGRMGHAKEALKLLTDATPAEAARLSVFLTKENDRRRATERAIFDQAKQMVIDRGDDAQDRRAIVLAHQDWHPGVVGIVASRLVEAFHRPTVILAIDHATGIAKGSARSVDAVDVHAAFHACAEHLDKFGGHAMAAGLTLHIEHIDAFRDSMIQHVNGVITAEQLTAIVDVDAELPMRDCHADLFHHINRLAPFGRSNPKPRLVVRSARIARPPQRMGGEGKHLALSLQGGDRNARAVAFGMGHLADELSAGDLVDVVFEPKLNTWRGVTNAELHVVDLRHA